MTNEAYSNIMQLSPMESLDTNIGLLKKYRPTIRLGDEVIRLLRQMYEDHFQYIIELNLINIEIICIALEAHYNRHGDYPDSLNELSPDILDVIPSDLLTDKQFTYIKSKSEIIIKTEFDFTSLDIHSWYRDYEKELERKLKRKPTKAPNIASDITPNQ